MMESGVPGPPGKGNWLINLQAGGPRQVTPTSLFPCRWDGSWGRGWPGVLARAHPEYIHTFVSWLFLFSMP